MEKSLVKRFFGKVDSMYESQLQKDTSLIRDVCFRVAVSIFRVVFLLFVFSSLGFIVHIGINVAYFWIALLVAFIVLLINNANKFLSSIIFFGALLFSLIVAFAYYDYSWDGRAYHQTAIYYFAHGWNPIYQKMADMDGLETFLNYEIWVEHYLKFAEITAACIYKAFGFIEIGKSVNYILAFSGFLYGIHVFLKIPRITVSRAFMLAFLLVFSPVVLTQISTYYVDVLLACTLCIVFLNIVDLELGGTTKAKYVLLAIALIATASIKLTGVAYAAFIGVVYLGYKLVYFGFKDSKSLIIVGIASACIIALCNINPLFTNIAEGKHPGYPLVGEGKIDIIRGYQPHTFEKFNRFEKMFYSVFSKTLNGFNREYSEFKVPFMKTFGESNMIYDIKLAGFGPYFGGILILCALYFIIHYKELRMYPKFFLAIIFVFGSVLINPEAWWARYAPHLWFVPFVFLVTSYWIVNDNSHKPFRSLFRTLVIVFLVMSVCVAFGAAYKYAKGYTKHINQIFEGHLESVYFEPKPKWERSFIVKVQERKPSAKILSDEEYQKLSQSGHVFSSIPDLLAPEGYWDMQP